MKKNEFGSAVDGHFDGIEQFEADLWEVADNLRANSNLASNEYFMPILGLIFLRHATNRYYDATAAIEEDIAAGRMPDRQLIEADFTRRRAMMLPEAACYDVLLEMRKDDNLGAAVNAAMEAVEEHFSPLAGQLPKDYERFEDDVLEEMMRTFDSETLRTASGDVFGRIYEYFLAEFSKQGAHDNGEFFTPPSIVQTIVSVIEPDHGIVMDPACGSGGMFVQSSHFIENEGQGHDGAGHILRSREERDYSETRHRLISPFMGCKAISALKTRLTLTTRTRTNWLASVTLSWPIHRSTWTQWMPRRSKATTAFHLVYRASIRRKRYLMPTTCGYPTSTVT